MASPDSSAPPPITSEADPNTRAGDPFAHAGGDHPHACLNGYVYIGHMVEEDGDEVEVLEAVPCRRCHLLAGEEVKA